MAFSRIGILTLSGSRWAWVSQDWDTIWCLFTSHENIFKYFSSFFAPFSCNGNSYRTYRFFSNSCILSPPIDNLWRQKSCKRIYSQLKQLLYTSASVKRSLNVTDGPGHVCNTSRSVHVRCVIAHKTWRITFSHAFVNPLVIRTGNEHASMAPTTPESMSIVWRHCLLSQRGGRLLYL